jgi:hypothetical protein
MMDGKTAHRTLADATETSAFGLGTLPLFL